ncbi:MAG: heavy metal translocating P-type ATPase [Bosea sp. (in: a-proteobacteria)]|jgi:heavy metal translocating P-type ATPase|uniref:P-type Zn(2+) transporter n=1 Tax=Bosea robiniae TaxID=1036780 RepID=A0ABY0PC75_9HYPH|nr:MULTISPECIES: heavy metal translocating P-type ATPase [Bosea]SDH66990.1 ATPase, P-type (transporting), HAD superfamily, subfamily IC/heavy metal translocating P-type ATPase [Bosea robiniae]
MREMVIHLNLFAIALAGAIAGFFASRFGGLWTPDQIWTAATIPVAVALAVSMLRDMLAGRFGVDAIALVAMLASIAMGEPLAGVVVAMMYSGGNLLEDYARGKAERELRSLRDRTPRIAHRQEAGGLVDIAAGDVAAGDELLVRAGELLPVDGELLDVRAQLDESAVTGEPLPETKTRGAALRSGTVNAGEAFRYRASAAAHESTYAGIIRMVEAAQTAKAPFIRMADRFALLLLPATLIVAGLAWWLSGDPIRALAVLVVATPCPLILAAPVAFIGGVSRAARSGILMKGSSAIEALGQVRTAIFDKTGTLTEGGARLIALDTAPGVEAGDILRLVASLEQASHHVLAETLVALARQKALPLSAPTAVREYRGSGLEGVVEGRHVRAGSRRLVLGYGPLPPWATSAGTSGDMAAALAVFIAVEGQPVAFLAMADAVRPDAAATLQRLHAAGVSRILMVTGDDAGTAKAVAAQLAINEVRADCSPADKVAAVAAEQARQPTVMIGDGLNDAPALAAANVGVAMGARGATASSEAADVVILVDRIDRVAEAVSIAQRTRAIALQSIVVGLGLSGIAMVFAAFGYIPPVAGAFLQQGIDIAVIINALRTLVGPLQPGRPGVAARTPRIAGEV